MDKDAPHSWDVFISYASEDRDDVAAPLAGFLGHLGLKVWFDQTALKVGDSLRGRIDEGLARSNFGIVVLSTSFFGKNWPTRELNGLTQLESDGHKVILPVWHGVDEVAVRRFSPPLADRIAVLWTEGVIEVALQIADVVRPDLAAKFRLSASKVILLDKVSSGDQLSSIIASAHMFQPFYKTATNESECEELSQFVQMLQDWGELWDDIDAGDRVKAEFSLSQALVELTGNGWTVYGARYKKKLKINNSISAFDVAAVAILRESPFVVCLDGDNIFVFPNCEKPPSKECQSMTS